MKYLGDLILSQENQRCITSWVWQGFAYLPLWDDKQKAEKPRCKCLLSLANGAKCDNVFIYCGDTAYMAIHLQKRHSKYVLEHDMKNQTNTLNVDTDKNTLLMGNMAKWTPERRCLCVGRLHTGLLSETTL